jgi:superfamily II DNA/RNA helicase
MEDEKRGRTTASVPEAPRRRHRRVVARAPGSLLRVPDDHRRALALDAGMDVRDLLEDLLIVSTDNYDEDAFVALVEQDTATLEDLHNAVEDIDEEEDDKLWQLAYLLDERPKGAKTLVFTTYKDTAEYLVEAFREHPGLGLEGRRLEVLHGGIKPETRTNVVERFAPRARGES